MKNYIKLFAVTLTCLLAACKGSNLTTATDSTRTFTTKADSSVYGTVAPGIAKTANFEINVPQGWRSEEKVINGRNLLFLLGPVEMDYQTNMNILKDAMKGESLDDYIKISLAKMQSSQVVMGATGEMQVDGITGKYLKYIYNAKERQIAVKSYVFPKKDTAYIITATTIPQSGKKYELVFDKAVNSLKIK